jgi:peptidoglycan/xylan/chitin deacetylase (PgdA/CDA1 family)
MGSRVGTYASAAAEIVNSGDQILGHSWNHEQLTTLDAETIRQNLRSTNDAIQAATGVRPTWFRPPGGTINDTLKSVAAQEGMSMLNWNVDPEDWKTRDANAIHDAVMSHVKPNSIVLMHDLYQTTVDAAARIIPELKAAGYQLVTVDELFAANGIVPTPGSVYFNG